MKMPNQKLSKIHERMVSLMNVLVEKETDDIAKKRWHYSGQFISGKLDSTEILFLGINPGFSPGEDKLENWKPETFPEPASEFGDIVCDYINQFDYKCPLATRISEIIFGGDNSQFRDCAETSFYSYFATPNLGILETMLNKISQEDSDAHDAIMQDLREIILDEIKPKKIICIGVSTFDSFIWNFKIPYDNNLAHKSNGRRYLLETEVSGIPVVGIIHLSGGRPNSHMKEHLAEFFAKWI